MKTNSLQLEVIFIIATLTAMVGPVMEYLAK